MKHDTRIGRLIASLLALVAGLSLGSGFSPVHAAGGIIVDDDGRQCRNRTTDTIAAALAMASDNTTITVCAGRYASAPLFISGINNLRLIARKGVILTPDVTPFGGEMITVTNSTNVTIQGFTIDGRRDVGASLSHAAIYFYQSSGLITKNKVVNWHVPGWPSQRISSSIWIDGTGPGTVTVSRNTLVDTDRYGIGAEGSGRVDITRNKLTTTLYNGLAHSTSILLSSGMTGGITRNKITSNIRLPEARNSVAILLAGSSAVDVSRNSVTGAGIGIMLLTTPVPTDSNTISRNTIREVRSGVVLQAIVETETQTADNNAVTNNRIINKTQGDTGILLTASGGNLPPEVNGSLQGELIKGNTVIHFANPFQTDQGAYGLITGVFTPNKLKP